MSDPNGQQWGRRPLAPHAAPPPVYTQPQPAQSAVFSIGVPGAVDDSWRQDATLSHTIRQAGAAPGMPALAHVYVTAPDAPLWIQAGANGAPICSVQLQEPGTFAVCSAEGALLARISRRGGRLLPWPRRTRWSICLEADGGRLTGKKGTWYAWTTWTVLSPFWFLAWLFLAVVSLWDDGMVDVDIDTPGRIRWYRAGSGLAMDKRGMSAAKYHLQPHLLDYRVAYAQAVLATERAYLHVTK